MYWPWFSRNNSISGATSLKALRKESLELDDWDRRTAKIHDFICHSLWKAPYAHADVAQK